MKKKVVYYTIAIIVVIFLILLISSKHTSIKFLLNQTNNLTNNDTTVIVNYIDNQNITGCTESDNYVDPYVKGTARDKTGSYTDKCDREGNLIEFYCAAPASPDYACPAGAQCDYNLDLTPFVVNTTLDCYGKCFNGQCPKQCPDPGNILTYTEVDIISGNATFKNTNGKLYSCNLNKAYGSQSYNCNLDPSEGTKVKVIEAQSQSSRCTENSFSLSVFDVRFTSGTSTCYYSCKIV